MAACERSRFFAKNKPMKNILVCLLLIVSLCSFTKKKKKPEAAFKKGCVTAFVAAGYPKMSWLEKKHEHGSPMLYLVGAEYQASRRFCFGLEYSYNYSATGILPVKNHFSGTAYQRDRWVTWNTYMVTTDYCYLNKGRVSLGAGIGLGLKFSKFSEHVIDSVGISTHSVFPRTKELAIQLRFVNAKVMITKNFGLYGSLGLGNNGIVAVGAHYTFMGRK